ncbi:MAG: fibrobacter succinogenes major paralogous domain-containing protein [Paludibacter sp.]|nr:fibrobacter succinogenes major paralogous domain-containing protein [Paludibacter sp.]
MEKIYRIVFLLSTVYVLFCVQENCNAFNYTISFTGSGASSMVGSVNVQNLTKGTLVTLSNAESLNLTDSKTPVNEVRQDELMLKLVADKATGQSKVSFLSTQQGMAQLALFSTDGKKLACVNQYLEMGVATFRLTVPKGLFLLTINGNGFRYKSKFINQSNLENKPDISFQGIAVNEEPSLQKIKKSLVTMEYATGDRLLFKGISGNYSTIVTDIPTGDKIINFDFVECKDANGNNYSTVLIGTQRWMAENLQATKYRNNEDIVNTTENVSWSSLSVGSWCNFNNDVAKGDKYGKLYNWYAVADVRNIAPVGWHVATDAEWSLLINAEGGSTMAGGKLKESGLTSWKTPNLNATNESGFNALPGGYRHYGGAFYDVNMNFYSDNGYWWTSTQTSVGWAFSRTMYYSSGSTYQDIVAKQSGFSVRCIKD